MKRSISTSLVALLVGFFALEAGAVVGPSEPRPEILDPGQAGKLVAVEDVTFEGNRVSGEIVNRESHPIRDVRLLIVHVYRWPNEYHPGAASPNNAETYALPDEIPAGERAAFSTTFAVPSPPEAGGTFATQVSLTRFTEVLPATPAPVASPARMR